MSTVLVTGAGGFVGGHLLELLRRKLPACEVVGTSRHSKPGLPALDITNAGAIRDLLADLRPSTCIHLAALASVEQSFYEPRAVWDVNLYGTLNLADALLTMTPTCRLIYASSAEVYGLSFQTRAPVTENTALVPANPYAASKAAADLALGEMALRGLRVLRLRLFNHIGGGQSERYVVPRFAAQIARIGAGLQKPIIYTGALDRWRDFLDVRDVMKAYFAALEESARVDGAVINICSGTARRVGDILTELMELAHVEAEIVSQVSEQRQTDVAFSVGSPQHASEVLGWRPQIEWHDTLRWLLSDWKGRVKLGATE